MDKIYNTNDFPYDEMIKELSEGKRFKKRNKKVWVANVVNSFDIETTSTIYQGEKIGFMYLWGFSFYNKYIIFGRTWEEFEEFVKKLQRLLIKTGTTIVVYIHNASFEFTFLYHYLKKIDKNFKYFATDKNKVLDFEISNIEFRCSYRLTNLSLAKACDKFQTNTKKLNQGDTLDLDYSIIRTPFTKLKKSEINYFINDLKSTVEIVEKLLEIYGDNIITIPGTATGYIRRITRKACNDYLYRKWYKRLSLPWDIMEMCIYNKKGGDTHCNRFKYGRIIKDCHSWDIKSSYPFQMLTKYFPISKFKIKSDFAKRFDFYIRRKCCLFYVKFDEVEIKPLCDMTVISRSHIINERSNQVEISDNGRVVSGKNIILCLNELDYLSIRKYYNIKGEHILKGAVATRGKLPDSIRDVIFNTFKEKCDLEIYKGTEKEYLYSNKKAELNAIYGMMLTSILHDSFTLNYNEDDVLEWDCVPKTQEEKIKELEGYFESYSHFLYFPVGLWVVSHARADLYELCDCCNNHIYHDTDSCKGSEWDRKKLEAFNEARKQKCIENNIVYKGIYLGTVENDGNYEEFISFGAKKYGYRENGEVHITIAGCNKRCANQLKNDLNNFREGMTFIDATNQAQYSMKDIRYITINGDTFSTAGGVYITKGDYTLDLCDDYYNKAVYTQFEEGYIES